MTIRELQSGPRLLIAIILGIATLFLPTGLPFALHATLAWVIGVAAFLGMTMFAIAGTPPERVRARARAIDERAWVIFAIIVAAATVSIVALGFVLGKSAGPTAPRVVLACLAVVASWLLVHVMFALHYAHAYYGNPGNEPASAAEADARGGLDFPGTALPDYWDFLYYAFVVGMTCQVSDVQVTSHAMRRLTLAHGVLAFFFNTGVLALSVNIIASAI